MFSSLGINKKMRKQNEVFATSKKRREEDNLVQEQQHQHASRQKKKMMSRKEAGQHWESREGSTTPGFLALFTSTTLDNIRCSLDKLTHTLSFHRCSLVVTPGAQTSLRSLFWPILGLAVDGWRSNRGSVLAHVVQPPRVR